MGFNTVIGALFQEGTSHVQPLYFNGQHFSHWKVRMKTYTTSYDIKVWRMIKKGNLPIHPKKDANGQVIISTDPLDLDDYTDEQAVVITINAKAKYLLYNAISGEEYKNISSCETAKEMWKKMEVTYEGTNKVKETRINLLVRDYELFQMKDGESVEEMFSSMMRRNKNNRRGNSNFKKGRMRNEVDKNDGRCYECGKFGHIQADCSELKKKLSRNLQKKKAFGAWSDEEESDHEEIANICFMALNNNEDS
nr:uncharacterized protein LOC104105783 [Nicotiana tomentosiformis]